MSVLTSLRTLHKLTSPNVAPNRKFYAFLQFVFNRVSKSRVLEVGPDRACAEWLMRNGAFIKWVGDTDFVAHYNNLPLDPKEKGRFQIQEVKACEASITHHGFNHFRGCNNICTVSFHKCWYLNDKAIDKLALIKGSLVDLEISECSDVTECGLKALGELCNLQLLTLGKMEGVRDFEKTVEGIAAAIPNCKIILS